MSTEVQSTFDYSALGPHARQVEHFAKFIRRQELKTIEGIIAIGQTLRDAKATIPHGLFMDWVAAEFPKWSPDTSLRYMRIADAYVENRNVADFEISVLHILLEPCAGDAIDEALEVAATGEPVTVAKAKEIAEKHKPPKKPKPKPAPVVVEEAADESDEPEGESWESMEEQPLPKGETVFTRLRELFDEMSPLQRVTAGGMWRNWCDPE